MPTEPKAPAIPDDLFFRRLVETSSVAFLIYDEKILYANPAAEKLTGFGLRELLRKAPEELLATERPATDTWAGSPELPAFRLLCRDRVRQVEVGTSLIEYHGQEAVQATLYEVRRPGTARALRMLHKAVETTQVGVTITDPGGRILFTNQAEAEMHGYTVEELVGRDVRVLAPPELARQLSEEELLRLHSRRRESVNLHQDGHLFPVHLASDVVADDSGEPIAVVTICRDLTAHRRAEDQRVALESQLRQAQKMEAVGQLAGGVAHDFNNLLVVIKGHSALALKKVERESRLDYHLTQVDQAADKAAAMTRQLLAISRRQELKAADLSLNEVVSNLLEILRRSLGENIELRLETCPTDSIVRIDRGQIEQVIFNLCLNARDAVDEQGHLTVRTDSIDLDARFCEQRSWAREGSWERLTVSDDGCGMDEETLSHVFEPFFTTKEAGKGTGLGLATVYGVVEQHDGFLHVESELGTGTTVEVYLPRIGPGEQPEDSGAPIDKTPVARGGSEAILVAEDDALVRQVVVNVLEKAGYTVLRARDGAEAVKVFAANARRISMVMIDLVMPVMGGCTAREHILEVRPGTRFLFTTGYASDSGDLATLKDVPLILKPYSNETLLKRVREVLDG